MMPEEIYGAGTPAGGDSASAGDRHDSPQAPAGSSLDASGQQGLTETAAGDPLAEWRDLLNDSPGMKGALQDALGTTSDHKLGESLSLVNDVLEHFAGDDRVWNHLEQRGMLNDPQLIGLGHRIGQTIRQHVRTIEKLEAENRELKAALGNPNQPQHVKVEGQRQTMTQEEFELQESEIYSQYFAARDAGDSLRQEVAQRKLAQLQQAWYSSPGYRARRR